ncbi:hypothetical protein JTB14_014630 [Gonioctena quinquepunctata]|nr:hypothetical protein JTB14_014630 [Gonioctena quinquepunctata]
MSSKKYLTDHELSDMLINSDSDQKNLDALGVEDNYGWENVSIPSLSDVSEPDCENDNGDSIDLHSVKNSNTPASSQTKKWQSTDIEEMYVFFAVSLLIPQMGKQGSKDAVIERPFFNQIISRDRYFQVLRSIHFTNNDTPNPNECLFKNRSINDQFRKVSKEMYTLSRNICIDESPILFEGRISFKQYIPKKRHNFEMKFFVAVICENRIRNGFHSLYRSSNRNNRT